jgi:hypothetical protein
VVWCVSVPGSVCVVESSRGLLSEDVKWLWLCQVITMQ